MVEATSRSAVDLALLLDKSLSWSEWPEGPKGRVHTEPKLPFPPDYTLALGTGAPSQMALRPLQGAPS